MVSLTEAGKSGEEAGFKRNVVLNVVFEVMLHLVESDY